MELITYVLALIVVLFIILLLILYKYFTSQNLQPAQPVQTLQPAQIPQIIQIAKPQNALDAYTMQPTTDYPGNNIACGSELTTDAIALACTADASCKGFSLNDGKPWCRKSELSGRYSNPSHTFYVKK